MTQHHLEHTWRKVEKTKQAQESFIAPELVDEYIKMYAETIIQRTLTKKTEYYETSGIAWELSMVILEELQQRNIQGIKDIQHVGYYIVIWYEESGIPQYISFNLSPQNKPWNNFISEEKPENLEKVEQNKKRVLRKENEQLWNILEAMENVFSQNATEWFGELNNSDIVQTDIFDTKWLVLKGKNIKELQELAQEKIIELKLLRLRVFDENIPQDIFIRENFETYLWYVTGIGLGKSQNTANHYEGGAKLFEVSREEVNFLIEEMLENTPSDMDILIKLSKIHISIDNNNYQNSSVEKKYKYFCDTINLKLFQRMKTNKATPEEFLAFARFVSGRSFVIHGEKYGWEMDSRLYNPELANTALLEAMIHTGIIERMNSQLQITDSLVGKKSPSDIYKIATKYISESITGNDGKKVAGNQLLQDLKFDDLKENTSSYQDLSYEDKVRTSVLARFVEKIKPKRRRTRDINKEYYHSQYTVKDLPNIFQEISKDAVSEITGAFSNSTDWTWKETMSKWLLFADGTTAQDLWFTAGSTEAQMYDTYKDINGSGGIFEWSDTSQEYLKDGAMMWAIVTGAMITGTIIIATLPIAGATLWWVSWALLFTTATNNVLIQWGIYGVSASMTSWGIDYAVGDAKWYHSILEAWTNIGTDLLVWWATWVFWWYLVSKYWVEWAKTLSAGSARNKWIFAGDLVFLGIGPEAGRMYIMDQVFHWENIFTEEKK